MEKDGWRLCVFRKTTTLVGGDKPVSTKNGSLAIDETQVSNSQDFFEADFEPKLEVIVNKRLVNSAPSTRQNLEAVKIRGRITISF